jgi:hypothetical protein
MLTPCHAERREETCPGDAPRSSRKLTLAVPWFPSSPDPFSQAADTMGLFPTSAMLAQRPPLRTTDAHDAYGARIMPR